MMKGHGRHLGQGDLDAQRRYPARLLSHRVRRASRTPAATATASWWPGGIGAARRRSRRSGIGFVDVPSTPPTCAARMVRPSPTPALADSARRPTSRTVPRRTLADRSMTNAERQPRYRLAPGRRTTDDPLPARRRPTQPRPALARCRRRTRHPASEYAQWFEALPENLQEGATGEACKRSSISTSNELDRRRATARLRSRLRRRYRCCLIGYAAYAQITFVQRVPRYHARHQSECPARHHRNTHIGLTQLTEGRASRTLRSARR